MNIFRNEIGFAPLLVNLEGYWHMQLAALPSDLRTMVEEQYCPVSWDSLSIGDRRNVAAQYDYQQDPKNEPSTHFELVCFVDELNSWIETARLDSKDAAVVVLRDVADRIEKILSLDRERVGTEIQRLRVATEQGNTLKAEEQTSPESNAGVIVALPHITKALEGVFKVMRDNWTDYVPNRAPKQTNIAHEIDKALGWSTGSDGNPSRNGKVIASIIKPDELKGIE